MLNSPRITLANPLREGKWGGAGRRFVLSVVAVLGEKVSLCDT